MKQLNEEKINKIRKNPKRYNWKKLCQEYILSEEFLAEFSSYVDWMTISFHQGLSENFIYNNRHDLRFYVLFYSQNKISEDLINLILKDTTFNTKDWMNLTFFYKLTENFILNHMDEIYWDNFFEKRDPLELSKKFLIDGGAKLRRKFNKYNYYMILKALNHHGLLKPPEYFNLNNP